MENYDSGLSHLICLACLYSNLYRFLKVLQSACFCEIYTQLCSHVYQMMRKYQNSAPILLEVQIICSSFCLKHLQI